MAANTDPVFSYIPATGATAISTANTNRDGTTGTYRTVFLSGTTGSSRTDGAYAKKLYVVAAGTTTAGVVRVWYNDGTNRMLIKEILVTAATPSTTVEVWRAEYSINMILPSGHSIDLSTHNAETFHCTLNAEYF